MKKEEFYNGAIEVIKTIPFASKSAVLGALVGAQVSEFGRDEITIHISKDGKIDLSDGNYENIVFLGDCALFVDVERALKIIVGIE